MWNETLTDFKLIKFILKKLLLLLGYYFLKNIIIVVFIIIIITIIIIIIITLVEYLRSRLNLSGTCNRQVGMTSDKCPISLNEDDHEAWGSFLLITTSDLNK